MSDFAAGFWVGFVLCVFIILFASLPITVAVTNNNDTNWRNAIVQHGGGYYAITSEGTSSWHWNENNQWNKTNEPK